MRLSEAFAISSRLLISKPNWVGCHKRKYRNNFFFEYISEGRFCTIQLYLNVNVKKKIMGTEITGAMWLNVPEGNFTEK